MDIVFFDEFGCSFQERLGRTWAQRGCRPVLQRVGHARRAVSTAAALTLSDRLYQRRFAGAIRSAQVIASVRHVLRFRSAGFVLIWDQAPIHKSAATRAFLAAHPEIHIEWLPGYAPELNPEEYCHGNVKQRLTNAAPPDGPDMRRLLDNGFARLRRRPDLLLAFIHAAGLSVKQLWLL